MKRAALILTPFIALGAAYLMRKANAAKDLLITPVGLDIRKLSLFSPTVFLVLEVTNTAFASITINSANLEYFAAGQSVGRTVQHEKIEIPSNQTIQIKLPVKLSLAGTITALYSAIKQGKRSAQIVGTINAAGFKIPINQELPLLS